MQQSWLERGKERLTSSLRFVGGKSMARPGDKEEEGLAGTGSDLIYSV